MIMIIIAIRRIIAIGMATARKMHTFSLRFFLLIVTAFVGREGERIWSE